MDYGLIFASAFAPGAFWLWYFYRKDALEKEPKVLLLKVFVLGMAVVVPVGLLEAPFPKPWVAILVAPVLEETAKFLVVRLSVYKAPDFNEPVDGIVYAAAAALGFASLENGAYLLGTFSAPERPHYTLPLETFQATFAVFMVRALLSVPGHVLWSTLWGHELGKAKWHPEGANNRVAKGLLLAIAGHALFNLCVSVPGLFWGAILLIVYGWRVVRRNIAEDIAASPFFSTKPQIKKEPAA